MAAALGAVALSGMVSCNGKGGKQTGAATVGVTGQALTLGDVKSVKVTVSSSEISTPVTVPLVGNAPTGTPPVSTQYSALVSDLPTGCDYVFTATAYAADGTTVLYYGATPASGQCIVKNQTANIIIDMNDKTTPVTVNDEAPFIDSITDTAACVSVGDTVTIKATAHDIDPGDTAGMTWVWSVPSCGTLSAPVNTVGNDTTPGTSTVVFTAVTNNTNCQVNLVVKDARMPTTLQTTAVVAISIGDACAFGSAKITAIPDTCPAITGLASSMSPLVNGQTATLTVTASDSDGDSLNYHWTSDCRSATLNFGSFGGSDPTSFTGNPATFTYTGSNGADCNFYVTVNDGTWASGQLAGQTKCSVVSDLSVPGTGSGYQATGACQWGYDYMSENSVKDGDAVTLEVAAPCANPVWSAGTPIANPASPFTTGVVYTAPTGSVTNGATVTVTCGTGDTACSHTFAMIGQAAYCAQTGVAAGADCTSSAQLTNKCILSATCGSGSTAGQCVPQTTQPCTGAAPQCQLNQCNPTTGQCAFVAAPNGGTCNDGLACDGTTDQCTGGTCQPTGTGVVCTASGNQCTQNTCQEPSGLCVAVPKADGTSCDDGNGCTGTVTTAWSSTVSPGVTADSCLAGVCTGAAVSCPSGDVCAPVSGNDNEYTCPIYVCMAPSYGVSFNPALAGMGVGADGTLWTTGSIYTPFNFGAGSVTSTGSADVFLNKVNPTTGLATASFTFGFTGGGDQNGNSVAVAGNGNVGLVGQFTSEVDFDSAGNNSLSGNSKVSGAAMGFYALFAGSSSGATATFINAHMADVGTGALLNAASNPSQNKIAICGKTSALVPASTKATGLITSSTDTYGGSMDIVVAMIDASSTGGAVLWGRQFGGVGDQVCESLAMDSSGNVIMGGTYNGALSFDTHALPTVATSGLSLPFVAILNSSGVATAAATWGTTGITDVYGIAVDSSSNIVIGGSLGASMTLGTIALTNKGKTDGFVAKLNSSLVPQWAFSFGDANDQAVKAVAVSSTGDVYMGGSFFGTLNGLNGLTDSGSTAVDAFTAHLSGANGAILCAGEFGDAAGAQAVTAVTVASAATGALANAVTIGGAYSSSMTLGATSGTPVTLNTGSSGTSYGFIARLGN
jgi:hypothetical protein